ncbi:MAG: hypothetical protein UW22_C0031G0009 [Candidatus Gottesmanbacteria bacterium GW2011_GWB1_44_11c]|uniref:Glycoside hydrolase family 5 domain-containing protein n=1 Tax=Candidatus Gottesmanbacteria bacterium GW2011_GWB1_44_11c TaxID=1618447 RepID=A0A0G1GSG5_9BACT|nr:MAG: hypothetical protein UW22_C0031G0009 [Candidatus Gottesmanbacteria bacterium GW2011_GWB1_44_11c]
MKRAVIITLFIAFITLWVVTKNIDHAAIPEPLSFIPWWNIQSVDTMKYSRDLTAEKINDPSFDSVIDQQVRDIAEIGATHVAIATPYDEEFLPFLKRWVSAARKYGLLVWFRGNFSGWEGWFGYPKISRDEHVVKTQNFILNHSDLFQDGDIFSGCPECENGGPGDPRQTGDVNGYRKFLITEYEVTKNTFTKIWKRVTSNYFSMNGDIARLIMDKPTTTALGGVVTIDHYVNTPERLVSDIREIAAQSGGKIFLGEFGVPIPDIHGKLNDKEQAQWIADALEKLVNEPSLVGLNYWVGVGGSTQIWDGEGNLKPAVFVLRAYFNPRVLEGTVIDQYKRPIKNAEVLSSHKNTMTDLSGHFSLPIIERDRQVTAFADGYTNTEHTIDKNSQYISIIIEKKYNNQLQMILDRLQVLFSKLVKLASFSSL